MKKYIVKVNGNEYEVEVDEIEGGAAPLKADRAKAESAPRASAPAAPVAPAAAAPAPVQEAQPAKSAPSPSVKGSKSVNAPMPGTILKVAVQAGDVVKKGAVLVVLEAMKMENDIVSPYDATVAGVHTTAGASVNTGDALVSFE